MSRVKDVIMDAASKKHRWTGHAAQIHYRRWMLKVTPPTRWYLKPESAQPVTDADGRNALTCIIHWND